MNATLADYVWCPKCRETVGEIWEEVVREENGTHYKHLTKPSPLPKVCQRCDGVLERHLAKRK